MFNIFKKDGASEENKNIDPLAKLGMNRGMLIKAVKQMQTLSPAQKLQVKAMFKARVKQDIPRADLERAAEEIGKQMKGELSEEEIIVFKKELIDLFGN